MRDVMRLAVQQIRHEVARAGCIGSAFQYRGSGSPKGGSEIPYSGPMTRPVINYPFAVGNPYQGLLYASKNPEFEITRLRRGEKFVPFISNAMARGLNLLHLHWDDRIFGREGSDEENAAVHRQTIGALTTYVESGGKIFWTIHNRVPHKEHDIPAFKAARNDLVRIASLIHVHTEHAKQHMMTEYGVDAEKIRIIPHPSYLGVYEPEERTLNRPLPVSQTRRFLFFGMLRGNKGFNDVFRTLKRISRDGPPVEVEIFGKGFKPQQRKIDVLNSYDFVRVDSNRVADEDVAGIFARAQVFLAPYQDPFTSGAMMLAQTFGLPIIAPDLPAIRHTTAPEAHILLYPPDDPKGLQRLVTEVAAMNDGEIARLRSACLVYAQARHPEAVAAKIAESLRSLI